MLSPKRIDTSLIAEYVTYDQLKNVRCAKSAWTQNIVLR